MVRRTHIRAASCRNGALSLLPTLQIIPMNKMLLYVAMQAKPSVEALYGRKQI